LKFWPQFIQLPKKFSLKLAKWGKKYTIQYASFHNEYKREEISLEFDRDVEVHFHYLMAAPE
jgi:hypothetical protein